MAKMTTKTAGKGRIVTPAPKSAKGKSAMTKAGVLALIKSASVANKGKGVKAFYTDKGAEILATAVVRASALPTMASAGVTTGKGKNDAKARRDFARSHRATLVNFSDILGVGKGGEITHDRPENTVRVRLQSLAKAMGLPADTFYAVRAEAYKAGETPKAYIVRK